MLEPIACSVSRITRPLLDLMEDAAAARSRGDHGAADAAERAAYTLLRVMIAAQRGTR